VVSLQKKRIPITGGAGFPGSFVVREFRERGCKNLFIPRSKDYDLVEMRGVKRLLSDVKPDVIVHLAARVGGIGAIKKIRGNSFTIPHGGGPALGGCPACSSRKSDHPRDHLQFSEVCARAFSGRGLAERISGRNKRALWPCKKNASGPVSGLSTAIWFELDFSFAGQFVWS